MVWKILKKRLVLLDAVVKFLVNRGAYLGACSVVQKAWLCVPSTLILTPHWDCPAADAAAAAAEEENASWTFG